MTTDEELADLAGMTTEEVAEISAREDELFAETQKNLRVLADVWRVMEAHGLGDVSWEDLAPTLDKSLSDTKRLATMTMMYEETTKERNEARWAAQLLADAYDRDSRPQIDALEMGRSFKK